jgi:SecD/SecF fusion protein
MVAVVAMVIVAALVLVPSLLSPSTRAAPREALPSIVPVPAIVLGLYLPGGAYILLEVDRPSLVKNQVEALTEDVREKLGEGNVPTIGALRWLPMGVQVRLSEPAERARR